MVHSTFSFIVLGLWFLSYAVCIPKFGEKYTISHVEFHVIYFIVADGRTHAKKTTTVPEPILLKGNYSDSEDNRIWMSWHLPSNVIIIQKC